MLRRQLRNKLNGYLGPIPAPEKWCFIVGCYNSGTKLLHKILSTHPKIGSMPNEGQFFTDQLLLPKVVGLPRIWALDPDRFRMTADDYPQVDIKTLQRQWGAKYNNPFKPVLIEKSPTNAGRTR